MRCVNFIQTCASGRGPAILERSSRGKRAPHLVRSTEKVHHFNRKIKDSTRHAYISMPIPRHSVSQEQESYSNTKTLSSKSMARIAAFRLVALLSLAVHLAQSASCRSCPPTKPSQPPPCKHKSSPSSIPCALHLHKLPCPHQHPHSPR